MTRPAHSNKPPMRGGVSASCVALPTGPWQHTVEFLAERMPGVALEEWLRRMAQGWVLAENGKPLAPNSAYQPNTRVYYYRDSGKEPAIPFQAHILFQDDYLLVADKPHFLPVTPGGRFVRETLLVRLKEQLGIESLSPLHRLDRETAGLVLFSIRTQDRSAYQLLFRQQSVRKEYEAVAPWRPDLSLPYEHASRMKTAAQFFRQQEITGHPNSLTRIELIESGASLARYRLLPRSGRTHQLRVHMNSLGIPILGDQLYPEVMHPQHSGAAEDYTHPLQLLARTIAFTDPVTGQERTFSSTRVLTSAGNL